MAKVRTFSRKFPIYHPKSGEDTLFVEKILNTFGCNYKSEKYFQELLILNARKMSEGKLSYSDVETFWKSLKKTKLKKGHTVRNGHSIKPGEVISMRVWYGKPYNSPQITFYDAIPVTKTWDIELSVKNGFSLKIVSKNGESVTYTIIYDEIAINDGLEYTDFYDWFILSPTSKKQAIFPDK